MDDRWWSKWMISKDLCGWCYLMIGPWILRLKYMRDLTYGRTDMSHITSCRETWTHLKTFLPMKLARPSSSQNIDLIPPKWSLLYSCFKSRPNRPDHFQIKFPIYDEMKTTRVWTLLDLSVDPFSLNLYFLKNICTRRWNFPSLAFILDF